MKKIAIKILTVIAACAAMVFASCAQPSTAGAGANGDGNEVTISTEVKEIDWGTFYIVAAEKFTGTEPKTISIYYNCTSTNTGDDNNYTSMKIGANYNGAPLGDGVATGATLKTDDKGAFDGTGARGEAGEKVITYKPTATEWGTMSAGTAREGNPDGLYINGFNIKINKVTLK